MAVEGRNGRTGNAAGGPEDGGRYKLLKGIYI